LNHTVDKFRSNIYNHDVRTVLHAVKIILKFRY
jgi:hypothetical protein